MKTYFNVFLVFQSFESVHWDDKKCKIYVLKVDILHQIVLLSEL